MLLMGIDIGTTNTKVGLFQEDGTSVAIASAPTVTHRHPEGYSYYVPQQMWEMVASSIREVVAKARLSTEAVPERGEFRIGSIGITSMAESGLLVDRLTGDPRSIFMPWFDTCSQPQADRIAQEADLFERFRAAGIHSSFKLGLPKLLWLKDRDPSAFEGSVWLSASGYVAYRLTGTMAFDYSLAARTFAFDIHAKQWDKDWIKHFGLQPDIFPEVYPAGTPLGSITADLANTLGLTGDIRVSIAGHDHVASALSVGAISPEIVYDSMGTAETLVGTLEERQLNHRDYESGLSFGRHVAKDRMFWMGGNSASGGSVEWLRGILGEPKLEYTEILALLAELKEGPSGILYFPYLTGSGAPQPDSKARAAFIGLSKSHGKGDLLKAVLEGTAYQLQVIREEAERVAGREISKLVVVGGGTRNPHWLQIKADVLNCSLRMPPIDEASLLGAALCAGIGSGVYSSAEEAATATANLPAKQVEPDQQSHLGYRRLYETGYIALQAPLRAFYHK
jgi:sugar (pentulose or hexulose) kinase